MVSDVGDPVLGSFSITPFANLQPNYGTYNFLRAESITIPVSAQFSIGLVVNDASAMLAVRGIGIMVPETAFLACHNPFSGN